ncbi:unnamed protein product [Urochloa humidicola]
MGSCRHLLCRSCSRAEFLDAVIQLAAVGALFSMVSLNKINLFPTPEPPISSHNPLLLPPPRALACAYDLQLSSPLLALAWPQPTVQLLAPPSIPPSATVRPHISTPTHLASFLLPHTSSLRATVVQLRSPLAGIPPAQPPLHPGGRCAGRRHRCAGGCRVHGSRGAHLCTPSASTGGYFSRAGVRKSNLCYLR